MAEEGGVVVGLYQRARAAAGLARVNRCGRHRSGTTGIVRRRRGVLSSAYQAMR